MSFIGVPRVLRPPMTYTLSEHDSKELLRAAGIAIPPEHVVANADDAMKAAALLGVSFRSLRYRLQKLGIDKPDDKEDKDEADDKDEAKA